MEYQNYMCSSGSVWRRDPLQKSTFRVALSLSLCLCICFAFIFVLFFCIFYYLIKMIQLCACMCDAHSAMRCVCVRASVCVAARSQKNLVNKILVVSHSCHPFLQLAALACVYASSMCTLCRSSRLELK